MNNAENGMMRKIFWKKDCSVGQTTSFIPKKRQLTHLSKPVGLAQNNRLNYFTSQLSLILGAQGPSGHTEQLGSLTLI